MTIPQYLAATGQDQQEFVDGVRVGAAEAVRADLALRAVIAQEEIEATDDEVDAEVDRLAEQIEREARQGPQGSRTAGCDRGGTLGHRTRQGARVPRSTTRRWSTRTATPSTSSLPQPEADDEADGPNATSPSRRSDGPGATGRRPKRSQRREQLPERLRPQRHPGHPRRARPQRHLLAAAAGPHHLPRHPDRRRRRQHRDRAAAPPRERGARQGHLDLHQLARRRDHRSLRHLRHDAVHQARRVDDLPRPGRLGRGGDPRLGRRPASASSSRTPAC